jgi:hypothetical protein
MDIPNSLLNSTNTIANEFQKMEIQAANQHTVVREASEQSRSPRSRQSVRRKSRPRPRVQRVSPFPVAGEVSGQCQSQLWSAFVSRQGSSFFPRSSFRPVSGRVAHHPARLPRSLFFRALPRANSPQPAPHKSTQSPCAAKRIQCVPWTTARGPWRKWQRQTSIRRGSSSGQHHTVRSGSNGWHRSEAGGATSASAHRIRTGAIGS